MRFLKVTRALWKLVAALLCAVVAVQAMRSAADSGSEPFTLQNVAPAAGLNFRQINFATEMKYPFETLGGAVAALDYNSDGRVDFADSIDYASAC